MRTKSVLAALTLGLMLITAAPARADMTDELAVAAATGQLMRVKSLLESGADLNARDQEGYTALTWAAQHGHTQVVDFLAERFAQLNAVDRGGYTPLMWAAQEGHASVVETLLKRGANPWVRDARGNTALSLAKISNSQRSAWILQDVMNKQPMRADENMSSMPGSRIDPLKATMLMPSAMLADQGAVYKRNRAHQALIYEGAHFIADYRNYVSATASQLGWNRMYNLNDPDLELGKYMTLMYNNCRKGVDLTRARRDWRRAKMIQEVRGESLFSAYVNHADRVLQDAGF